MKRPDAIVVGGGLAGLGAALRIAQGGASVLVLERGVRLGGRAGSYLDSETGAALDTCQHVAMGCCAHYRELLSRLGAEDFLRWTGVLTWTEAGGRRSGVGLGPLPAPLHLLSGAGVSFLGIGDRLRAGRAVLALARASVDALQGERFDGWLARHRQSDASVRRLWTPLVVGACNARVDQVSAAEAAHLVQRAFVSHRAGAEVGVPVRALSVLAEALRAAIEEAGGEVRLRSRVERIGEDWVDLAGERLACGRVVCATAFSGLGVVDEGVRSRDGRIDSAMRLEHAPIVGVYARLARGRLPVEHSVLVDRETDWVFRKDEAGREIHAVKSAAAAWVELGADEIAGRVMEDLRRCFPGEAGDCVFETVRVVKEKRATFLPDPESWSRRPDVESAESRLLLAGDYVRTGWPATMEGALRSGNRAAECVLGLDRGALSPAELGLDWPAALLGFGQGRATV